MLSMRAKEGRAGEGRGGEERDVPMIVCGDL